MIDIDDFKNYNDKYGQEKGDTALIRIGRLLMRLTTRGSDFVFRLGGQEFAVIFSGLDPEAARLFSEKISGSVALRVMRSDLTGGGGVNGIDSKPGWSYAADVSMYDQTDLEIDEKES